MQHAPFPAAVQDAATVYADVLRRYSPQSQTSTPSTESKSSLVDDHEEIADAHDDTIPDIGYHNQSRKNGMHAKTHTKPVPLTKNCKIILIGDSAGGNLVLALARWIRDEQLLPPPDGLLLLSPSCDPCTYLPSSPVPQANTLHLCPAHAFPDTPSSYVPRPHASTDYLVDTPEPRALLQRTFLGHNPLETMHSPYVSPASHKVLRAFYGELFVTNVEELTIHALTDETLARLRSMDSLPPTPNPNMSLPPPTPVTPGTELSPSSLRFPVIASPRGLSLFSEFPEACVVLGDAERLEREVVKLVSAMERDGVGVRTVWVEDGPHDVLMMGWWDERVRDRGWGDVERWVGDVARA